MNWSSEVPALDSASSTRSASPTQTGWRRASRPGAPPPTEELLLEARLQRLAGLFQPRVRPSRLGPRARQPSRAVVVADLGEVDVHRGRVSSPGRVRRAAGSGHSRVSPDGAEGIVRRDVVGRRLANVRRNPRKPVPDRLVNEPRGDRPPPGRSRNARRCHHGGAGRVSHGVSVVRIDRNIGRHQASWKAAAAPIPGTWRIRESIRRPLGHGSGAARRARPAPVGHRRAPPAAWTAQPARTRSAAFSATM